MVDNRFTKKSKEVLNRAESIANDLNHCYVGTEHILAALVDVEDCTASVVLRKHGVTLEKIYELMENFISPVKPVNVAEPEGFTPRAKHILESSVSEAKRFHNYLVGTEHILIAILKEQDSVAARLINTLGINVQKVYFDIISAMGKDVNQYKQDFQSGKMMKSNGAKGKNASAMLSQFTTDLNELAQEHQIDPVIGRQTEMNRIIQILCRRTKNNPCLVGEPGVGKTAVVEGMASMLVNGLVPEAMKNKRILTLDVAGMVAGSKYRGEFEERIKRLIAEVKNDGDIILFVDEIHTLIGAGGAEGAIDAANILKPALARGEIQIIGATTRDEYRKYFEKDAALARRFQPVAVEEPDVEKTIDILKGLREKYEEHHNVIITDDALEASAIMSERYINDRYLPDKAIDLMDEASSKVKLNAVNSNSQIAKLETEIKQLAKEKEEAICSEDFEHASVLKKEQQKKEEKLAKIKNKQEDNEDNKPVVTENDIALVVSEWTKIPARQIEESEMTKLRKFEETLHKRVIGQEEAVTAVAKAIKRGRVGLKDPKRPIGSFLFLGPTGVGKTELSKALAESVFGSEKAIIRVDMSEYMEKHSVSKMIGSPPGYVGYEEGGQLSERVRKNPYSVVLFDEIEKAHPDVFNILLQVLDEGHITDNNGKKVDFKNTIIIMTSNVGAQRIVEPKKLGFSAGEDVKADYNRMKKGVMDEVKQLFKPEFINRIDELLVFHSLTKDDMKKIVTIMLKDIIKRAKEQLGINLVVTPTAKALLIDESYDSKYGARPLRRKIQSVIEDGVSEEILNLNAKRGDKVTVSVADKKFKISVN